jgi:hypothetical protein
MQKMNAAAKHKERFENQNSNETCPTVLQNHDDINKQSSLLIYKNIISTRHKE